MTQSYQEAKTKAEPYFGVGLGLRWDFLDDVLEIASLPVRFFEISPENYMGRGGYFPDALERLRDRYPFVTHGLTMSVGAHAFPEESYMAELSSEIARVGSPWHSDHLCLSTAGPLVLHDLLPLTPSKKVAQRAADRIRAIEDRLGVPFAIENISFYAHAGRPEMPEHEFLCEVLHRSSAGLLLDVNNVYVNALNHGFDAEDFIRSLPHEQVVQLHVAGHTRLGEESSCPGLLLDTHGSPVVPPVKNLLDLTLRLTGPLPVVLERDNDVPEFAELVAEVEALSEIYDAAVA